MPLDERTLARHVNGVLVETGGGTCRGTHLAMKLGFNRAFVVEFAPDTYEKSVRKFRNEPRVEVIHGDSGVVLADVIAPICEPITFWLDAHGRSCDTTGNLGMKPLLRELAVIADHPLRDQHTIMIDDWYVVEHPRKAVHLTEENVREALLKINPEFYLYRVDGFVPDKKPPRWQVVVAEPKGDQ